MTQRIVDERKAVNVDETHRNALEAAGSHLAQRTIQLIHEVAAVRQPRGRVVVAGMLAVLAQRFILLRFYHPARLRTPQARAPPPAPGLLRCRPSPVCRWRFARRRTTGCRSGPAQRTRPPRGPWGWPAPIRPPGRDSR